MWFIPEFPKGGIYSLYAENELIEVGCSEKCGWCWNTKHFIAGPVPIRYYINDEPCTEDEFNNALELLKD